MALCVIALAMTPLTETKLMILALIPLGAAVLLYTTDRRTAAIIVFLVGWLLIGLAVTEVAYNRYPKDWQVQEFGKMVEWGCLHSGFLR